MLPRCNLDTNTTDDNISNRAEALSRGNGCVMRNGGITDRSPTLTPILTLPGILVGSYATTPTYRSIHHDTVVCYSECNPTIQYDSTDSRDSKAQPGGLLNLPTLTNIKNNGETVSGSHNC